MVTLFELESGARAVGLGGAFAGLADDENALFYNPAGLAYLDHLSRFSSLYESHFGLTDFGQLAVSHKGLGLGLLLFNSRPIIQRDEQGKELGQFSYSAVGLAMAYASTLGRLPIPLRLGLGPDLPAFLDRLALGARLKLYRVKSLEEGSGATLALDPSVMFDFGRLEAGGDLELDWLRLGLVLENLLGAPMEFGSGHREQWPLGFRLGGSLALSRRGDRRASLVAAADLESDGTFHLGAEYRLALAGPALAGLEGWSLALRGGLMLGRRTSFALGLGLALKGFQVDYAFSAHPQLPLSHLLGFSAALNLDP
ncbi:MAG: hypothetical protein ACUVUT_01145 [Candidatus Bipolaricaulia bacterium]